ncbi:hypothetical protein PUNSTDRAFT_126849 [Punctularia strigosozonata HHB-11173 SS5]|uniref:uncharacterized protein n=1 Tax=Punctularia strigosozonata (strain HHB-11173) TaxID=741275 RepID=UPI0004416FC8|nr:uncharacterized protein PUNSTDRAFT_126849 [Punctularia strigosozonata HHB-11173 SS5]EIN08063.1 hypothetical protein PUNSTDRAFT_126849 [Punctularia strigosozonata HHB-11173 SS5]
MSTPIVSASSAAAPQDFRLPTAVRPSHYDVTIRTDLEKLTFDGFVKINLDVKAETSTLVFNSSDLNLGNITLQSDALHTAQTESSRSFEKEQERMHVHFATSLPAGSKAQLQIAFDGKLTGSMMGYYYSTYEQDGKTKYYALTQFEPTAARRSFPCWDEPALKATFAVTLISRADTVSLSNMPAISEEVYTTEPSATGSTISSLALGSKSEEKWKITKFETTPPMSSYIVAWANGPFAHLESSYTSPISGKTRPLRIYATPDLIHQAQFGLDVKAKVLPIYEKVFDIEYPLPKLDTLVATDFDAGAMENWGLITGRTSMYLLDAERADIKTKKRIATTQSHEVAHMWFGNITTMEWWTYLYLNEGFATLMGEVIIIARVFPEWKVYSEFITDHLQAALHLDAKLSSHPVEVDCPDANEINQIFDSLSYSKAASVLRMLANWVGEEQFVKGVSLYLKKRLYGNSVSRDLWEGIGEATGKDVAGMVENWISKMGFPVLTVTETEGAIKVRQDRFLETGPAEPKDNETIWTVPLSLQSSSGIDTKIVLDKREDTFAIDTSKPWKLNAGTTGVYRVLYTPERLNAIAEEAARSEDVFSLEDRIGLVYDTAALSEAGFAKVSSALSLYKAFKDEKEFLVWGSILSGIGSLRNAFWENDEIVEGLRAFTRELAGPLVARLGYEYSADESPDITELRTLAVQAASGSRLESTVEKLHGWFTTFLETGSDDHIPPELLGITYSVAVWRGGRAEFEALKKIHAKPRNPAQAIAAMQALGSSEDPALARETLEYALEHGRDQDIVYFFGGVSANRKTRRVLTEFFKERYDQIYKRFDGNFSLKFIVERAFNGLSSIKDHDETVEFFRGKDISKYRMSLEQTLDSIKAKAALIERSKEDVEQWLAANVQK